MYYSFIYWNPAALSSFDSALSIVVLRNHVNYSILSDKDYVV